eukprot:TRINITY_DN27933_c0_g3_i1.p1 TRINITY_DN27933_c0_g3~~TRINITY_DN27933_c0_g3_i1.p1  ORF type:complete len:960 (-),score=133.16 TRINITY_DN27933_c0_g3_i1:228-3107(-)
MAHIPTVAATAMGRVSQHEQPGLGSYHRGTITSMGGQYPFEGRRLTDTAHHGRESELLQSVPDGHRSVLQESIGSHHLGARRVSLGSEQTQALLHKWHDASEATREEDEDKDSVGSYNAEPRLSASDCQTIMESGGDEDGSEKQNEEPVKEMHAHFKLASDEQVEVLSSLRPADPIVPEATAKSGRSMRSGRSFGKYVMRGLSRGASMLIGRIFDVDCDHVVHEVEERLYSQKHHGSTYVHPSRLLAPETFMQLEEYSSPDPGVIRFGSLRARILAVIMLIVVSLSVFVTPISFVFGGSLEDIQRIPGRWGLIITDIVIDFAYGIFLIQSLNTSYICKQRKVEIVELHKIRAHYMWSFVYWFQLLTSTTYIWVVLFGRDRKLIINIFKFIRFLHFANIPDSLWEFRDQLRPFIKTFGPVLFLYILAHWTGCLLACWGGFRDALEANGAAAYIKVSYSGYEYNGSLSVYLEACIEAITLWIGALDNPLGFGSFREGNAPSLMFIVLSGPLGCVLVSTVCASVFQNYLLTHALEIRQEENLAFVKKALHSLNVPKALRRRVYRLHEYQKINHDQEAFGVLFSSGTLSGPLDCALRVYLYTESVLASPFFHGRIDEYIVEVVTVLQDEVFVPGDFLVRRGELAWEMFFVGSGALSILIASNEHEDVSSAIRIATKGKGDYFGEMALIHACLRTAWVRADSYVVAPVLSRASIEPIWQYFPEERELMVAHVEKTLAQDARFRAKHRWKRACQLAIKMNEADLRMLSDKSNSEGVANPRFQRKTTTSMGDSIKKVMSAASGSNMRTLSTAIKPRPKAPVNSVAHKNRDSGSKNRTLEDIQQLQSLARLCETALEQQKQSMAALDDLAERQLSLEARLNGQDGSSDSPKSAPPRVTGHHQPHPQQQGTHHQVGHHSPGAANAKPKGFVRAPQLESLMGAVRSLSRGRRKKNGGGRGDKGGRLDQE